MMMVLAGCMSVGKKAKPELEDIVYSNDTDFSCTFEGVLHDVILCVPDSTTDAPLVIMLHGEGMTAGTFKDETSFDGTAMPRGYGVAYVTGSRSLNDAAGGFGWDTGTDERNNKDAEFLEALAGYLQEKYRFDSSRTFAVGFSSGAFMAHRLAAESNAFAAVVSVAGKLPESIWEKRPSSLSVGVFQVTGEKDEAVPQRQNGTDKHTTDPPIEDVMEYYASADGASETVSEDIGKQSVLTKHTSVNTQKQVWELFIGGGGHSWYEEDLTGIDLNSLILDFLDTQ